MKKRPGWPILKKTLSLFSVSLVIFQFDQEDVLFQLKVDFFRGKTMTTTTEGTMSMSGNLKLREGFRATGSWAGKRRRRFSCTPLGRGCPRCPLGICI